MFRGIIFFTENGNPTEKRFAASMYCDFQVTLYSELSFLMFFSLQIEAGFCLFSSISHKHVFLLYFYDKLFISFHIFYELDDVIYLTVLAPLV
jgi:hypothetical protein